MMNKIKRRDFMRQAALAIVGPTSLLLGTERISKAEIKECREGMKRTVIAAKKAAKALAEARYLMISRIRKTSESSLRVETFSDGKWMPICQCISNHSFC